MKIKYSSKPQRKAIEIAAGNSRSRTVEPVDTAKLHKSVLQHCIGLMHAALGTQAFRTRPG